jgi:hypothetical protein
MKMLVLLAAAMSVAVGVIARQPDPAPVPAELVALLAKASISDRVVDWCAAAFQAGQKGAYAVALEARSRGCYVVVTPDGGVTELSVFDGAPDLACYTAPEARKLDETIKQSETIEGSLAPQFNTTVVCGFVEATQAVCWQYASRVRRFIVVGRWRT